MRKIFQVVSAAALLGTIGAPLCYLAGWMDLRTVQSIMLLATLGWFVHAPLAIGSRDSGKIAGVDDRAS